ncbi:MAG TPA: methyltransferase domain-containing protein [Thermodesulfobacteriota bacterium]|nr:methyltransferase domain-containing protein [Thermodesulfobacteriota bacterium]
MGDKVSWSKLFRYRDEIHRSYHDIWDLKILRKRFPLMVENIRDGERILDIGASDRSLQERLRHRFPRLTYKSMDVDRERTHDFYSLEEIRESFDVIFLFEVIEHLDLEEGIELLKKVYGFLNEGGRLILTTPNVFNPSRFWRDATHKVAYCYDELGGLLLAQGFQITGMYRTYSDAFHRYFFRLYVMAPLHRYLGVDFAKSILVIAEKKSVSRP